MVVSKEQHSTDGTYHALECMFCTVANGKLEVHARTSAAIAMAAIPWLVAHAGNGGDGIGSYLCSDIQDSKIIPLMFGTR